MRIDGFRSTEENGLLKVSARVSWEDSPRAQERIFFATRPEYAGGLTCGGNAFLLASLIPAMHHGERRVLVEGALCPQLRNGLVTAMQILRKWYGEEGHRPVAIEATGGFVPSRSLPPARTASFMSGGVDSLATVRCNRLDFPLDHPASIKDCLFVHGFDIGGYRNLEKHYERYESVVGLLRQMATDAEQLEILPVYTNLRYLEGDDVGPTRNALFTMESHAAAMAAIAHAFSRRVTSALIASTASVRELEPLGSHPLLDTNYSSSEVRIHHDGAGMERLEKVRLVADWPAGLNVLRACHDTCLPTEVLNCGRCEKCIRTMTELLIVGRLKQATTYPLDDVSPRQIRTLVPPDRVPPENPYAVLTEVSQYHWAAMIGLLEEIGRRDLVAAIQAQLADFRRYRASVDGTDWKSRMKRLDRRWTGGSLSRLLRSIRS